MNSLRIAARQGRRIDLRGMMSEDGSVETTLELPDDLFQAATQAAAADGRPLKELVTEALRDKLTASEAKPKAATEPAWLEFFGAFGGSTSQETRQIQQRIDAEFGQPDPLEYSA